MSNRAMPHQLAVSSGVIKPKYPAAPRQWVTYMGDQPQPSGALPTPNLSTGVRRDFSRGWGGDRESQFPRLDAFARAATLGAIGKVLSEGLQGLQGGDEENDEGDDPTSPTMPPPPSATPPSGPSVDDDDDDASGVMQPPPRAAQQQANSTGASRWISGGGRGPGMSQTARDRIKDDLAKFEGYQ